MVYANHETHSFVTCFRQQLAVLVPSNSAVDEPWNTSNFAGGTVAPTTQNMNYVIAILLLLSS
jgi:hypothetical protein